MFYAQAQAYLQNPAPKLVVADGIQPGAVTPYVSFSQSFDQQMKESGFDVAHPWLGYGSDTGWQSAFAVEPAEGVFNWSYADETMQKIDDLGMKGVILLQCDVPTWFANKYNPPSGYEALVDPNMLGYLPSHMAAWGDFFSIISQRYGSWPNKIAWSVVNEPVYYNRNGATNSLLDTAIRNYLKSIYPNIGALNSTWGTSYASFDAVVLPTSASDNPRAWYDMMVGKTKCFEGALKWQADLLEGSSTCKRTGCKFVLITLAPSGAATGWGVNPFVNKAAQQGVSMVDIYSDSDWEAILRTQELYDSNSESPVLSMETGTMSRPAGRNFRWHIYPDSKAQSYAWTMFQHGLFGCSYWTWGLTEEFACLDWDGGLGDFALQASMMNQKYRVYGDLLSTLKPVREIGYYYPYATFIQGSDSEKTTYATVFQTLTELGYQTKIFSAFNIDDVLSQFRYVIVPPAAYMERSVVSKLQAFVQGGGKLIVLGTVGTYDEYRRSLGMNVSGSTRLSSYDAGTLKSTLEWLGKKAETQMESGSVYRTMMKDARGNKYMAISNWDDAATTAVIYLPGFSITPVDPIIDLFSGRSCGVQADTGGTRLWVNLPAHGTALVGTFTETTVRRASQAADNLEVTIGGAGELIVSDAFSDCIYVENEDRSCGIKVTGTTAAVGDRLSVTGKVQTGANLERYVAATTWSRLGSGTIKPVGLNLRSLRRGEISYDPVTHSGQKGMPNGAGLSTVGLLVRVCGGVYTTAPTYVRIRDVGGSNNVTVLLPTGVSAPSLYSFVTVTGVVSTELVGGNLYPVIRANDITIVE